MGEGEGGAVELYRIEKRQIRSGGGGRLNLDEGLGRRSLIVTGTKAWLVSDRNARFTCDGKQQNGRTSCSRCKF